jgi:putative transcriptional regulator
MLRLKLDELLQERGRSAYSVAKETGLKETTLWRLRHNKGTATFNTIDLLCKALDCQPGDLLEYIPDKPSRKDKQPTSRKL